MIIITNTNLTLNSYFFKSHKILDALTWVLSE